LKFCFVLQETAAFTQEMVETVSSVHGNEAVSCISSNSLKDLERDTRSVKVIK